MISTSYHQEMLGLKGFSVSLVLQKNQEILSYVKDPISNIVSDLCKFEDSRALRIT